MVVDLSDDNGFTLVELLIAIAIVGLTMSFAVVALGTGRQLLSRLTSDRIYVDDIALIHATFSQALSQVSIRRGHIFSGTADGMHLMSAAPRGLGQSNAIDVSFEPGDGEHGVVANWRGQSGLISKTIAQSVRLRFSYFDGKQGWIAAWTVSGTVPRAVKIEIFRGYGASPSEMIVPVRLLDAPDCEATAFTRCLGR